MNKVILRGRFTKDPELKYTQSGKAVCKYSVAVNRDYNKEQADFINCISWDKGAEIIAEYMRKGNDILVEGRIQTGSYDKDDGSKVFTTDVVVDKFEFIGGKKSESAGNSGQSVELNMDDEDSFPF